MANELEVLVRQQVTSPAAAIKALREMERELSSKATYQEILRVIREAEAIKVLYREVQAVKAQGEDTILVASKRVAEELARVPKAAGRPAKISHREVTNKPGKADTGIPRMTRSRLGKLAAVPVDRLKKYAEDLRAAGKDATPRAVITLITQGTKAEHRARRERALGARQRAMPESRYGVIYIDPPWHLVNYSDDTGMDRAAENHYPTMTLEEIRALQLPAAEDCVLFLWAPTPHLYNAFRIVDTWGFEYRSCCVWIKHKIGLGRWFRDKAEHLLVGVRGNVPAPAPGEQYPSSIEAAVTSHSAKPACFREMIEKLFPSLPRIEMFARERVEGWHSWGNEIEPLDSSLSDIAERMRQLEDEK